MVDCYIHARIQNILSVSGGDSPDFFYLVIIVFFPLGPIASRGGSVPVFLRKHIGTCDFPGGCEPSAPIPYWIHPCYLQYIQCIYRNTTFSGEL